MLCHLAKVLDKLLELSEFYLRVILCKICEIEDTQDPSAPKVSPWVSALEPELLPFFVLQIWLEYVLRAHQSLPKSPQRLLTLVTAQLILPHAQTSYGHKVELA